MHGHYSVNFEEIPETLIQGVSEMVIIFKSEVQTIQLKKLLYETIV